MSYEYVLDSYLWIEYFKGSKAGSKIKEIIEKKKAATPTIVLAELSDKYHRENWSEWNNDLQFILSVSSILTLTAEIAVKSGEIKHKLRKISPNISTADAIIYVTAKMVNAKLVTGDSDFQNFKDVTFISNKA